MDTSNLSEFKEFLQSEVWVDLDKLKESARHGVPSEIRGEVWIYLLGVQQADRSNEVTNFKARAEQYRQIEKENTEITKRVRSEIGRYQRRVPESASKEIANTFENVIVAYLNNNRHVDYDPALVSLCFPMIKCIKKEAEAYYAFEKLMNILEEYHSEFSINQRVAAFMTLFRLMIPDLFSYFEDEEVNLNEWATSWLQNLLAKELQFDNLMRLWDTYFSVPDPLDLHPFVCLAILRHYKEKLEDLEQSEIRTMLLRLPSMDVDSIINQAFNMRHETLEGDYVECDGQ